MQPTMTLPRGVFERDDQAIDIDESVEALARAEAAVVAVIRRQYPGGPTAASIQALTARLAAEVGERPGLLDPNGELGDYCQRLGEMEGSAAYEDLISSLARAAVVCAIAG